MVERKPPRPRRITEGSSEHEVYLPTGALSPNRQNRDPLPDTLLKRVKQFSGRLSTEAVGSMQDRLPFFADLDAAQRAGVQMLVQTAVVNFLEWLQDPDSDIRFSLDAFQVIPQDLARRLTLRQTVDMVRVAMEFFEQWLPALARNDRQLVALTEAVLRYGRELGFAAASVYASAAESRGAWDTRLEALVVDAVVRGDTGPDMLSRAATLNWDATAPATVLVGTPPGEQGVSSVGSVHAIAARHGRAALAVVQGTRLVMVVSGHLGDAGYVSPFLADLLAEVFSTVRWSSADHPNPRCGARERRGGVGGYGGRGGLARGAAAGARGGAVARTRFVGRSRCDRRAERVSCPPVGRRWIGARGHPRCLSGLRGSRRDVRPSAVRPSKYRSLSTQTDRRDNRPGSDESAGRLRTPDRSNGWSFDTNA